MSGDPRLNLFDYANTILNRNPNVLGTPHATRCPTVVQRLGQATQDANSALEHTLGLVGDYANLANDIGGGSVGSGLATLARVSNEVRISGVAALPAAAIGNGQHYVLNTLGMDPNKLTQAAGFNPNVANTAFGAASQVYNSVSQGKFSANDIPAVFSAFQNGTALMSSLFTPNSDVLSPKASQFGQNCGAGNYAVDLIALAPKYKFLFVVEFEFHPDFTGEVLRSIDPAFVIKSSTRPTVDFEYEDVNMYNFRTKVPRKTTYQPITMKFLDDDRNNAFQLYTAYLKVLSPIANVNAEFTRQDPLDAYDQAGGGMGFVPDASKDVPINASWDFTVGQGYAGSLGAFGEDGTRNILRRVTIYHVYRQGRMMNVMHFYNPKITKMELDELDMASSEGTEVSLTFSYDSVFIIPGYRVFNGNNTLNYNLHNITDDGLFPLGVDPGTSFNDGDPKDGFGLAYGQDTLLASNPSIPTATTSNTTTTAQGTNLTGLGAIASTITSKITSAVSGIIPNFGGNNQLPTTVSAASGSAFHPHSMQTTNPSVATTMTASAIDPITGIVPASANNTNNVTNVITNAQQQLATTKSGINTQLAAAATPEETAAINQAGNDAIANIQNINYATDGDVSI